MYKKLLFALLVLALTGCSSVLLTGRKQLNLVSDAQVLALSDSSYHSFMASAKLSAKTVENARVQRVGRKISAAVDAYLKEKGIANQYAGYSWDFKLVKDTSVNAFCMPGGKIVAYEGLLPVTQTDAGLAVVMGHEIAHAIAKHANERMSQQLASSSLASALSSIVQSQSQATQTIALTVFGLGAQYGVALPYSRKQEYEADQLGLIFMAMAGYDPMEAINFWSRMSSLAKTATPEFLSTHPSDAKRIANMYKVLPEAQTYFKK